MFSLKKWENHPNLKQRNVSGKPKTKIPWELRMSISANSLAGENIHHYPRSSTVIDASISHQKKNLLSYAENFLSFSDVFSIDSVGETIRERREPSHRLNFKGFDSKSSKIPISQLKHLNNCEIISGNWLGVNFSIEIHSTSHFNHRAGETN